MAAAAGVALSAMMTAVTGLKGVVVVVVLLLPVSPPLERSRNFYKTAESRRRL